jgi:hypothetical protein
MILNYHPIIIYTLWLPLISNLYHHNINFSLNIEHFLPNIGHFFHDIAISLLISNLIPLKCVYK